ncbi:MAG TPA: hypothetical protein DCM38_08755 [Gammaproteobacteria bacterium]|nr:hypothetical protein [Gammaproteobacteria bacterium]
MRQELQITLIFEHSSLKSGFQHLYCANKFYPHLKKSFIYELERINCQYRVNIENEMFNQKLKNKIFKYYKGIKK